ncbi:hypothetical protein CICLE_v10003627mg [Citrus x clementina]|uniref:Uncharacterized protein n=2 Tax=Citrus TaxID=2706 RepID=V4SB45_CITCL|nr:hypothetical protein CICLE_v10003627mg [Citrus x clementina]
MPIHGNPTAPNAFQPLARVDESVTKLDCRVPPVLKQVPAQALSAAQMAPVVARSVASEVKTAGVAGTASGMAKSQYAVSAWRKLNQMPLFPQVAQVVVPTAAYCSEKYNQTVVSAAEKGYKVSSYLPLVPTERIAKVFSNEVVESQPLASAGREADVAVY